MRLLRKTGIRSPFLPGPIQSPDLNPLRATIVIGAIVPALLLGGITQPIGRLPRDEDPTGPTRPAALIQQPVPAPGATVVQTYAPRDLAIVQVDHTWPSPIISGGQPQPNAQVWMPSPARLPNTDPLRPPLLAQAPPDPTLALSNTTVVGRLSRPEDVQWPARPAVVQIPPVPIPGASLWAPTPARDPNSDPLRPLLSVQDAPDATLAQSSAILIGRLARAEDTNWPARPATLLIGAMPVPDPRAIVTTAPRDEPPPPPDRLSPPQLIVSSPPFPAAQAVSIGAVHDTPLTRLPLGPRVDGPPVPQISALALSVGRAAAAPTERVAPTQAIAPAVPIPGAVSLATYALRDQVVAPADRVWPLIPIVGVAPQPGAAALVVGAIHTTPLERLALTAVQLTPFIPPSAIVLPIGVAHDGDRLAVTQSILALSPPPSAALSLPIGTPRAPSLVRLPLATLPSIRPTEPLPGPVAVPVGFVHATPLLRLAPAWVVNPPFVPPPSELAQIPIGFRPRAGASIVGRITVVFVSTSPGATFIGTSPVITFEGD